MVVALLIAASLGLAILAAVDGGSVLLTWDEPIQRWVEAHRNATLDVVFRGFSRIGSNIVVFAVAAVLFVFLIRRCRPLAFALAVAVLARPVFELVIKELVDRPRPELDPLINGVGPSHPSGHVLAAVALWGLIPPIVAVLTDDRRWWWLSVGTAGVLIVGIALSRVYLGVHWFSDILQGVLLGALYLVAVEAVFERDHRRRDCVPPPR